MGDGERVANPNITRVVVLTKEEMEARGSQQAARQPPVDVDADKVEEGQPKAPVDLRPQGSPPPTKAAPVRPPPPGVLPPNESRNAQNAAASGQGAATGAGQSPASAQNPAPQTPAPGQNPPRPQSQPTAEAPDPTAGKETAAADPTKAVGAAQQTPKPTDAKWYEAALNNKFVPPPDDNKHSRGSFGTAELSFQIASRAANFPNKPPYVMDLDGRAGGQFASDRMNAGAMLERNLKKANPPQTVDLTAQNGMPDAKFAEAYALCLKLQTEGKLVPDEQLLAFEKASAQPPGNPTKPFPPAGSPPYSGKAAATGPRPKTTPAPPPKTNPAGETQPADTATLLKDLKEKTTVKESVRKYMEAKIPGLDQASINNMDALLVDKDFMYLSDNDAFRKVNESIQFSREAALSKLNKSEQDIIQIQEKGNEKQMDKLIRNIHFAELVPVEVRKYLLNGDAVAHGLDKALNEKVAAELDKLPKRSDGKEGKGLTADMEKFFGTKEAPNMAFQDLPPEAKAWATLNILGGGSDVLKKGNDLERLIRAKGFKDLTPGVKVSLIKGVDSLFLQERVSSSGIPPGGLSAQGARVLAQIDALVEKRKITFTQRADLIVQLLGATPQEVRAIGGAITHIPNSEAEADIYFRNASSTDPNKTSGGAAKPGEAEKTADASGTRSKTLFEQMVARRNAT